MNEVILSVTDWIDPTFQADVAGGLAAFNAMQLGPSNHRDLSVSLYRNDEFLGGLAGFTAWNWLFIKWLWIRDDARGLGFASRALAAAETEAKKRGCNAAWLDTLNPAAHDLYKRHGFDVFGELKEFHGERSRYFMQKRFS